MALNKKIERLMWSGFVLSVGLGTYLFQEYKKINELESAFSKGKYEGQKQRYIPSIKAQKMPYIITFPDSLENKLEEI